MLLSCLQKDFKPQCETYSSCGITSFSMGSCISFCKICSMLFLKLDEILKSFKYYLDSGICVLEVFNFEPHCSGIRPPVFSMASRLGRVTGSASCYNL